MNLMEIANRIVAAIHEKEEDKEIEKLME